MIEWLPPSNLWLPPSN